MWDLDLVSGRDECIVPMLDHARFQTCCEGLYGYVKLEENEITTPPPHESDCVSDDSCQDKFHGTSCSHLACTDFSWFETDL